MSHLTFFAHDFEGQQIRTTADKRFSVYDVMVAMGVADKASNAKNVLERLHSKHSEVTTICSNFQFPGRGQRQTPVADEQGIYQILMLCPGGRAAEFRQWAAGIIADPNKAFDHAVRKYIRQGKSEEWIQQRLEGIVTRHHLTDVLKAHGVKGHGYAQCSDAINVGLLGKTAKQLQAERGVKRTVDGFSRVEVAAKGLADAIAADKVQSENRWGNRQCSEACGDAARKVRRALED